MKYYGHYYNVFLIQVDIFANKKKYIYNTVGTRYPADRYVAGSVKPR